MATSPDPITPASHLTDKERKQARCASIVQAIMHASDAIEPKAWLYPRDEFFAIFPGSDPRKQALVVRRWRALNVTNGHMESVWELITSAGAQRLGPSHLEEQFASTLEKLTGHPVRPDWVHLFCISEKHVELAQRDWIRREVGRGVREAMDAKVGGE